MKSPWNVLDTFPAQLLWSNSPETTSHGNLEPHAESSTSHGNHGSLPHDDSELHGHGAPASQPVSQHSLMDKVTMSASPMTIGSLSHQRKSYPQGHGQDHSHGHSHSHHFGHSHGHSHTQRHGYATVTATVKVSPKAMVTTSLPGPHKH